MKKLAITAFLFSLILIPSYTLAGDVLFEIPEMALTSQFSWGKTTSDMDTQIMQRFVPINFSLNNVCSVSSKIAQTGSPTDDVVLDIYPEIDPPTTPDPSLRVAHVVIKGSDLPTSTDGYTTFHFDNCLNMRFGLFFWFVWSRSSPNSQGEYITKRTDVNTTYWARFYHINYATSSWVGGDDFEQEWSMRLESGTLAPKEPVIIVPGIMGSYLNRVSDNAEVWPNATQLVLSKSDDFLNDLKLNQYSDGIVDIYTKDIIRQTSGENFYGDLLDNFKNSGYTEGKDLIVFPYDWRMDVASLSLQLEKVINDSANTSPTGKVSIVAHSMGGVVTKEYLAKNQADLSKIDKIVFAGMPQLGAVGAFKLLNFGDDLNIGFLSFGLNSNKAKEISQNMPAIYQLLPSREYIDNSGSYVEDYRSGKATGFSYDQINNFMLSDPSLSDYRNPLLLNRADQFHQNLDNLNINGPQISNIVGCSVKTLSKIQLYDKNKADIKLKIGDGTVPLTSATKIFSTQKQTNYYAKGFSHLGLVSNGDSLSLINSLITGQSRPIVNDISQSDSICQDSRRFFIFSTHSPVNLKVSDSQGNYVGLNPEGDVNIGIPDSDFIKIGENNFVIVPEGSNYRASISAYATGSFDFKVKTITDTDTVDSAIFLNIPISNKNLKADLRFNGQLSGLILNIDKDGNGSVDQIASPDSINTSLLDSIPPQINIISPASQSYERSGIININVGLSDNSGISKYQYSVDGQAINSGNIDLFFYKIGSHVFTVIAYDKAGNIAVQGINFQVTATVDSAISDIQRAYTLGWINKVGVRDTLIDRINKAAIIQKKIVELEEILPNKQKVKKRIEKLEKRLDKVLAKQLLDYLDTQYSKGSINDGAYGIIKEDINWMLSS